MILILAEENDTHAAVVRNRLLAKGASVRHFNTADFPQQARITIRSDNAGQESSVLLRDGSIDLSSVRTVWYRRPQSPHVSVEMDAEDQAFARDESTHLLRALWALLRDRFWVNPWQATARAEAKPLQLQVARQIGFEIPQTLITNDPGAIQAFFRKCRGQAVYKTLTPVIRRGRDGKTRGIYTSRLTAGHIQDPRGIQAAPCLFQEYVPKRLEVRVTVIGSRVFAAEIHSQNSERSRDDWRRYDLERTPYLPHRLPAEIEDRCLQIVRTLDLVFGCIDLILTPDNRYVFLEINPNGQWYWIERLTNLPLLEHFAGMLLAGAAA